MFLASTAIRLSVVSGPCGFVADLFSYNSRLGDPDREHEQRGGGGKPKGSCPHRLLGRGAQPCRRRLAAGWRAQCHQDSDGDRGVALQLRYVLDVHRAN